MKTVDITKMAADMGIKTRFLLEERFMEFFDRDKPEASELILGGIYEILSRTQAILAEDGGIDKNKGISFTIELPVNDGKVVETKVAVEYEGTGEDHKLVAKISKSGV